MKKVYKVLIQEEIRVWRDVEVEIATEDSQQDIMNSIESGEFMSNYEWEDINAQDIYWETEDTISWDYGNTRISDIREV